MSRTHVETRWMKFENIKDLIILCEDVIAIASGIFVMFFNLNTREETIETFDDPERGKGASCLAGHPVVPMFATAERRSNPKISIFTYPGIRKISSCVRKHGTNNYLSCVFAGTEYLLSLTGFPDFQIIIWLWRTGENMTSIDTTITDQCQRIICSPSSPYQVSQFGEFSGYLIVYEINVCSRIVTISRTNENSSENKIVSSSWTSDGNLINCDANGNITLNYNDGKRRYLIVRGEDHIDPLNSKGNLLIETFRSGVIFVNGKSKIMFYRRSTTSDGRVKSGSLWKLVWSVQAISHPRGIARSSHRDNLLFYGDRGEIFELSINDEEDSPKIRVITYQGSKYEFLTAVNPISDQIVVIDDHDRLSIFQCLTGQLVTSMCLKIFGRVRCIASQPNLPMMAIGTTIGKFIVMNLMKISQPSISSVIHLQRESLEIIRYSWCETLVGIVGCDQTKLFIIDNEENENYSVLDLLQPTTKILDFLIYENDNKSTKILILAKTSKSFKCGHKIIVYSFKNQKHEKICVIQLTNMLDSLYYGRNKYEFIVVPYLTKLLHFFQIQDDFQGITLTEALSSGHQLRNIKIGIDDRFFITCSYDGLIIMRNKTKIEQVVAIFMSHHRLDGGTKMAILASSNNTIVSLGRNGDLIATKICNLEFTPHVTDDQFLSLEKRKTKFWDNNLTWIEQRILINQQKEREECAAERNSILQDFGNLQERLRILLDANEDESTNDQLPISHFDLDEKSRAQKIQDNIANGAELMEKLEKEISQRDKVSKFLRKLCWESMEIHASSLLSVNGKTRVDNFPLPRVTKEQENDRQWESFIVQFRSSNCWKNMKKNVIPEGLSIMGTTTHRFIPEMLDQSINQIRKCPSYNEGVRASIVIRDRERKLKIYFNELFENMRLVKENELSKAAERIKEIEHCALELKNMFHINLMENNKFPQPLWHSIEKPETIVNVTESEISNGRAATYLERDIRLEILRKQEEESLKLNDSFREEALEIMMDGLLEVRWEDEIKKDPPRPLWLSIKDPANYTEEEMAESEIYRIKCEELEREREKYKKLLQEKIMKVEEVLRQDVEDFDRRLDILYLERMKIESAILQERSMRLRESNRHSLRRRGMEIMELAQNELSLSIKELKNLSDLSMILETAVTDTKNRYENLSKRDKTLDGKFRGEFPDLKQPMVEHLLRHYRKRPRNVQLICTSITYLTETGRCIMNGEKSEILPRDCIDFLHGMNNLDAMPNNLPAQIDTSHWDLLCKLRRAKVDLEIKIKSCAVDLAEAEQTFALHQKSCTSAEIRVIQNKEMIKEIEIKNHKILENMQVQLVLKMGQIESNLYGDMSELSNAVLVPLYIVEDANNAIIGAGRKKLAAMRKTVVFRRTTLWREWRHKCMRITLNHMREELNVLQGVKVTREIQNYLLTESRDGGEKKAKMCERIVASTSKRLSRMLEEKKRKFKMTTRKITFWRNQNKIHEESMETMKLASFKVSMLIHDENRQRDARYRRIKLKAIMKRTRLMKKVQDNYNELLALQTQLELLRLKTYPTLRLKGLPRSIATSNKRDQLN